MKGFILLVTLFAFSARSLNVEASDDALTNFSLYPNNGKGNLTVLESWENIEKIIKEIANAGVKMVLPVLMDNSAKLNLSRECMKNSMHLISGVKNIKPWALRFIDSSGKIMDGLLTGSLSAFGAYDECVDTEVKSTRGRDKGKVLYRGQYCTINVAMPLPPKSMHYKMDEVIKELKNFSERDTAIGEAAKLAHFFHFLSLRWGICTPSGCTIEDMDKIASLLGSSFSLKAKASRCELRKENKFSPLIITVMACFSFPGILMLVGSLIDVYAHYRKVVFKSKFIRILVAFSLLSNFRKFVSTSTSSNKLSCLNGVRFLTISWIILGHTYLIVNYQMFIGFEKVRNYGKDFAFQAIVNGTLSVDTFFFIGGLLVCYVTMNLVRIHGQKFHVGLYIFHRLWRILPAYMYVIMFMFLLDLLGSGPLWYDTTHKYIKMCHDNWWTNLLFINNFYDSERICIPHSWYLACDFQLYVGSLIILIPLIRWPKKGIILGIVAIISSAIYSGVGTYINGYPPTMLFVHPDPEQLVGYWAHFYFRPFIHVSPYCIGLLSGYLLSTKPDLKIPPIVQVIGWGLAFISNFSVLYGVFEWNKGAEPLFWSAILYASLSRTAWTLGVAWVIICCATGNGGVINYILSWKAFVPLGRLSYVAYLVHLLVQLVVIANIKTQVQPDHFFAVYFFFGHLCVTYGIAFAGSMLIESPFISLEKILLRRDKELENKSPVGKKFNLKGSFKSEKNGDISAIVPNTDEESGGIKNRSVIYNL